MYLELSTSTVNALVPSDTDPRSQRDAHSVICDLRCGECLLLRFTQSAVVFSRKDSGTKCDFIGGAAGTSLNGIRKSSRFLF